LPGPSARRAPTGLGKRLGGVLALGFSVATTLLSGCVVVKPYQREQLAERCMSPGFGDASELKFRAHWEGSRQGGEGGFGTAGGGCGCN
jgi:hypothetical protein